MKEVWYLRQLSFLCRSRKKKFGVEVRADARALPPEASSRRRAASTRSVLPLLPALVCRWWESGPVAALGVPVRAARDSLTAYQV